MQNILEINMKKISALLIALFISSWHIADTSPHTVTGQEYTITLLQDKPSQRNTRKEEPITIGDVAMGDEAKSKAFMQVKKKLGKCCLLYTSPSPRDRQKSRMPSSA